MTVGTLFSTADPNPVTAERISFFYNYLINKKQSISTWTPAAKTNLSRKIPFMLYNGMKVKNKP